MYSIQYSTCTSPCMVFGQNLIPAKKVPASEEEQNDANFISIAPSSEELGVRTNPPILLNNRTCMLHSALAGIEWKQ